METSVGERVAAEPAHSTDARPARLRDLPLRERRILLALVLLAAALRIGWHVGRPLEDDEIGTLLFLREPFGVLLSQFGSWLTMNVYLAGLKALTLVLGDSPWVLAAPSLVAGVALVPVVAAVVLRLGGKHVALLAAALTAYDPFLVLYSTQARAYMAFTLCAWLALLWLVDWTRAPGWRVGWKVALASAAAFLLHANAVYQVAGMAVLLPLLLWRRGARVAPRELASLLAPCALALGAAFLAYVPLLGDMARFREMWSDAPPTPVTYLPGMFESFFGGGWASLATAALIAVGLWRAAEERRELVDLGALVAVPMALVAVLGVSHWPWSYARFLLPCLPVLFAWIACASLARCRIAAVALACAPFLAWVPGYAHWIGLRVDYPWNAVAAHLSGEAAGGERILALDASVQHDLSGGRGFEERFVDAAGLVALAAAPGGEVRVLVLADEPHLEGAAESRVFGRVQVAEYRGASGAEVARALAQDLVRATGGRVEPELTDPYRQLFELHVALGREAEALAFQVKFLKCQGRLFRQLGRPAQMP